MNSLDQDSNIYWKIFEHPFSRLIIGATEKGCCMIEFFERRYLNKIFLDLEKKFNKKIVYNNENTNLQLIEKELEEYFKNERRKFTFTLDVLGSDFELNVWKLLLKIPYGSTKSYQDIAFEIGDINLARKVGTANGANNIAIVIPCHRVIGKDGNLTGYGGGMSNKKKLLRLENPDLVFKDKTILNRNKVKLAKLKL